MRLSELLARHLSPVPGTDIGTCYICGSATSAGYRQRPSQAFTAWASCVAGDVICAECWICLQDRRVRSASWLVTADAWTLLTKDTPAVIWEALMNPPHDEYGVYLTRGRQKQGWIVNAGASCRSRQRILLATDWVDTPVILDAPYRDEVAPLLIRLRSRNVPKQHMIASEGEVGWEVKATREGWVSDLNAARHYAGDPRWEVMVHAVP